jgi:hypothetical protein
MRLYTLEVSGSVGACIWMCVCARASGVAGAGVDWQLIVVHRGEGQQSVVQEIMMCACQKVIDFSGQQSAQ